MNYQRAILLLVLAALLPLVVFAAAIGAASLRQRQEDLQGDAEARVQIISGVLDRELNAEAELLNTLAQSPVLDGTPNAAAFDQFAGRVMRQQPHWRSLSLLTVDGLRLMGVPDGVALVGARVIDPESLQQAVATGRPTFGSIRIREGFGPAFAIRAPVLRDGKVRYVLSAVVRPDRVQQVAFGRPLPKGWLGAVVDTRGHFVARTLNGSNLIGHSASASLRNALTHGTSGAYRGVSLEGVPIITVFQTLPASGWSVHVAMPQSAYNAPFRRSLWLLSIGAALTLVMVAVFLGLLARELTLRRKEDVAMEQGRRLEALGRMTGGVAHDFNNLLMVVRGSAEMLKRPNISAEKRSAFVEAILAAADSGQTLTRQLLGFGARSAYQAISFRIQDRATAITALVRRSIRDDISMLVSIPEDVWLAHADPNWLEIAILNLAINARDAMPDGGKLSVEASNVAVGGRNAPGGLSGEFVAIRVADTGTGIPEDQLGRVFEPFYTTKAPGKGTGLGLSQVYGFARQSHGAVTVENAPEGGAVFTIYLPRSNIEPSPHVAAAPEEGDEGRILLVEDNPDVARATQALLESAGYEVTWAANPAQALKLLLDDGVFDAVLTDIVMEGGLSGIDLGRELRRSRPDLPVVMMTGYSEALAVGGAEGRPVLRKPFDRAAVVAALKTARRGQAAGRDAAEAAQAE